VDRQLEESAEAFQDKAQMRAIRIRGRRNREMALQTPPTDSPSPWQNRNIPWISEAQMMALAIRQWPAPVIGLDL
jgi:hypothetical protein